MLIHLWSTDLAVIECCICGEADLNRWGLPFCLDTGELVSNDFEGDWGGKPACRVCFAKHANGELTEEI